MTLILTWAALTALWGVCYELFLKKLTFWQWNRGYLLAAPLIALALWWTGRNEAVTAWSVLPEIRVGAGDWVPVATGEQLPWLLILYLAGLAASFGWFAFRLIRIVGFIRRGPSADHPSFSFGRYIHVESGLPARAAEAVRRHEEVHVRMGHTADVIFYELVCCFQWFNPMAWRMRSLLCEVHEFQADAVASGEDIDYSERLLAAVFGVPEIGLVHSFHHSLIEKRMLMLHFPTPAAARWRYALLLPLLVLSLGFTRVSAGDTGDMTVYEKPDVMPDFPGGFDGLIEFLGRAIKYPEAPEGEKLEGKVIVKFIVDRSGEVRDLKVVQGLADAYDSAALSALSTMPDWKPGEVDGRPVYVEMVLPVMFKLK